MRAIFADSLIFAQVLDMTKTNMEAFQTGNTLVIDGMRYPIVLNAPTVVRISLPKIILSGDYFDSR